MLHAIVLVRGFYRFLRDTTVCGTPAVLFARSWKHKQGKMTANLVSPTTSQEDEQNTSAVSTSTTENSWLTKLWSGQSISKDQLHLSAASTITFRGRVQTVLEPQYRQQHEESYLEQTPMILTPFVEGDSSSFGYEEQQQRSSKRPKEDPANDSKAAECHDILAFFYYDQYTDRPENLLLNQWVEVVGVYEEEAPKETVVSMEQEPSLHQPGSSTDPSMVLFPEDADMMDTDISSSSLMNLPRFHVLFYKPCRMEDWCTLPTSMPPIAHDPAQLLSQSLGVDLRAALAVWVTLFGRHVPNPAVSPNLGCVSLHLVTSTPDVLFERLRSTLSQIVPILIPIRDDHSVPAPHTVDFRLVPSPWQVGAGSTVLVQTKNAPSAVLQSLVNQHKIPYHFDGNVTLPFDTNASVLVISSMESSVLTPSLTIPCSPLQEPAPVSAPLETLRHAWIHHHCSFPDIDLPQSTILARAQQDFVQFRQKDSSSISESHLHAWLTLTRALARSEGRSEASIEDWERAVQLERGFVAK